MQAPTPENYKQWVQERNERTIEVMKKQNKISGMQCRQENLSLRMLYDNGYVLNNTSDTLEKENVRTKE